MSFLHLTKYQADITEVTQEMAYRFLGTRVTIQYPAEIEMLRAARYAVAMADGQWRAGEEEVPVSVSKTTVVEGLHRFVAITLLSKSVMLNVKRIE